MLASNMSEIIAIEKEARRLGATDALSRVYEKARRLPRTSSRDSLSTTEYLSLDDVLDLIDEEIRDA